MYGVYADDFHSPPSHYTSRYTRYYVLVRLTYEHVTTKALTRQPYQVTYGHISIGSWWISLRGCEFAFCECIGGANVYLYIPTKNIRGPSVPQIFPRFRRLCLMKSLQCLIFVGKFSHISIWPCQRCTLKYTIVHLNCYLNIHVVYI